jgi:23S rRNA (uracil1939-C5)-methyltransferase
VCDGRPPFLRLLAEAVMGEVPEIAGVLASRKRGRGSRHRSPSEVIAGSAPLVEKLAGGDYRISADSFFQGNPVQTERVIGLVRDWAQVGRGDVVLDVYTGVGTFLLPLARSAKRAIGVEADASSLSDARANARRWRLGNVDLYERKAERLLSHMAEEGWRADVIVMNPPRKGCGPIVCASAAKLRPKRIILISCHPATLARDLKSLAEFGYVCRRVQPVDMFPQTWHVEAVALCERQQASNS